MKEEWKNISEEKMDQLSAELLPVDYVREHLHRNEKGKITQTIENCLLVVNEDAFLNGLVRLNLLSCRMVICKDVPWRRTGPSLTDNDMDNILTIILPDIVFDYLRAEEHRQKVNRLAIGSAWSNPDNLVFTNKMGQHFSISKFYKDFKRIAASIGRPDARPHDLRHTAATVAMANSNGNVKAVQSLLGHSTASFTMNTYAHTTQRMMEDQASRVQSYYDSFKKQG